jgi:peptidoglycan hydrolase-like protein with peptidoglycan-binding domain
MLQNYKKIILFFGIGFLFFAVHASAANIGDVANFNVDQGFDVNGNSQLQATLVKTSSSVYFYIDTNWWNQQSPSQQSVALANLDALTAEFDSHIYPTLTSMFGYEWRPGIDNDSKITILFENMKEGAAGYFRSADEYSKLQVPNSNEREMVYLSLAHINDSQLKMFLGHEFTHLIEFNQKDRINGTQEEIWLNEARADYASTLLGYDAVYEGSNLQRRVRDFLQSPSDSITEWHETKYDYAVVNVFIHYLVDHYGTVILSDSLKSKLVGIDSINEALQKHGIKEDFSQIFTNWTIATILNDCNHDLTYCYITPNLGNFRISPVLNFLPLSGNSSLSVTNVIKNWSANWQKIIGGNGDLSLDFKSLAGVNFKVPYIVFDKDNQAVVNFLQINSLGKAHLDIASFGSKYNSLVIIPSLEAQFQGFDTLEISYPYTFTVSISGTVSGDDPVLIAKLLAQIDSLKKQIAAIQSGASIPSSCAITSNLYVGVHNAPGVTCLQKFLKMSQTTGYFGSLTKVAVIAFQQKYALPVTGFVGALTRAKIIQSQ